MGQTGGKGGKEKSRERGKGQGIKEWIRREGREEKKRSRGGRKG